MGSLAASRGLWVFVLLASASSIRPETPSTSQNQPVQQSAVPATHVFGSDAGLVLNFIKPDKTADFDAVIAKLKEALQKSDKPERDQYAEAYASGQNFVNLTLVSALGEGTPTTK
jgi:hypothetical protein